MYGSRSFIMLLLSGGGLDSAAYMIMLHDSLSSVLSVNYGQACYEQEYKATEYFASKYSIPHICTKTDMIRNYNKQDVCLFTGNSADNAYVNGRNLSLIMQGLQYDKDIVLGFTNPGYKPFPDADEDFLQQVNTLLNRVFNYEVTVQAPFLSVPRVELFKQAYLKDNELFDKSMTCWTPVNGEECGKCKHCLLKAQQKQQVLQELKDVG